VNFDDETLMAYADGELDAGLKAQIDAAIEQDPALAQRVEQHRTLRARISGAYGSVLDRTLPERLRTAARGESVAADRATDVIRFPVRGARGAATSWRGREWAAMAASVMLGVLISWQMFSPGEEAAFATGDGALLARGDLAEALERQLASEQHGGEPVLIGLTFRSHDGDYCRTFTLRASRTTGLACRVASSWQVAATDTAAQPTGQYQQASAAMTPAILRQVQARMDGEALDASGEQDARLGGWKAER
jgi:hypothetical protein